MIVFEDDADVLVIGDVMVDEYVHCVATRISPEAPVPVLVERSRTRHLGGAGNVAANLASLGVRTRLVGLIGDRQDVCHLSDWIPRSHRDLLQMDLVETRLRRTTTKTRLMAGSQQVARLDLESAGEATDREQTLLRDAADRCGARVIVVSDYAKGAVFHGLVSKLRRVRPDAWIIVDPKQRDWSCYDGADVITPNEHEVATRVAPGVLCHVLITRGASGADLCGPLGNLVQHIPAENVPVADVIGAGDTVVAGLAFGRVRGLTIAQSAEVACRLAGAVVSRSGTSLATLADLP